MVNFKEAYKKYINYIVIILLALLCLKSCQSCTKSNRIRYVDAQHVIYQDSVNVIIADRDRIIDSLNHELTLYKYKVGSLQDANEVLKSSNKNLNEANSNLSRSNRSLSESNSKLVKETNKE